MTYVTSVIYKIKTVHVAYNQIYYVMIFFVFNDFIRKRKHIVLVSHRVCIYLDMSGCY